MLCFFLLFPTRPQYDRVSWEQGKCVIFFDFLNIYQQTFTIKTCSVDRGFRKTSNSAWLPVWNPSYNSCWQKSCIFPTWILIMLEIFLRQLTTFLCSFFFFFFAIFIIWAACRGDPPFLIHNWQCTGSLLLVRGREGWKKCITKLAKAKDRWSHDLLLPCQ